MSWIKPYSSKVRFFGALVFIVLFAGIGVHLLTGSHASTPLYTGKLLGINDSSGPSVIGQLGVNSERGDIELDDSSGTFPDASNPQYYSNSSTSTGDWINSLTAAHMVPLPILDSFDSYNSTTYSSSTFFPDAVKAWCATYCAGGTFWNNNTTGDESYAPHTLEILNEPYGSWYRGGALDGTVYGQLLVNIRSALDTASPSLSNISIIGAAEPLYHASFDDAVNAAGGYNAVQGITVHPYSSSDVPAPGTATPSLTAGWDLLYYLHQTYGANIYVTEDGWCTNASGTAPCSDSGNIPESSKDANITNAVEDLGKESWIKGFWYFNLNPYKYCLNTGCTSYEYNTYGLNYPPTSGGGPSPAYGAFQAAAAYDKNTYPSDFSLGSGGTLTPSVSITTPANNASISGTTTISANASESGGGIASVQFKLDGNNIGSLLTTSPYSYSWDSTTVGNGTHTLTAVVTDTSGNTATSSPVTVTVNNQQSGGGGSGSGPPSTYNVSGNKILDANGNVFTPHGVDRPSLEWTCTGLGVAGGTGIPASDYTTMKDKWGANTVRISVSQDLWLGGEEATSQGCTGAQYQQTLKNNITAAQNAGLVVILDLHWSDKGNLQNTSAQQCMPDQNSNTFWQQAAAAYKSDTGVWFELYNEPQLSTSQWSTWENGGNVCGFNAVGMQTLYNTVRAAGANNIVIAGGVNYASNLNGVPLLSGTNITYAIHPYANPPAPNGFSTADWDNRFGNLSAQVPVIATEFGNPQQTGSAACTAPTNSPSNYSQAILNYFRSKGMGYTAWAWYADVGGTGEGPCGFPVLITDAAGDCYADDGSCLTQQDLLSYANGQSGSGSGGTGSGGGGSTPTQVQNFAYNSSSKTLTWSAFPGASSYTIAEVHNPNVSPSSSNYRNPTNYSSPHDTGTSCVVGTSCAPTPASGETVNFSIIPNDSSGNSLPNIGWEKPEVQVVWPVAQNVTPPSQPTGLSASAVSSSQINLSWTDTGSVPVSEYQIYRSSSSSSPGLIGTTTTTSYGDTGLTSNTTYSYYVVAVGSTSLKSTQSSTVSAKTRLTSPGTTTLEGYVDDNSTSKPIANARIRTGNNALVSGGMALTQTNSNGFYMLINLSANRKHDYVYSASGYRSRLYILSFPANVNTNAGYSTQNVKLAQNKFKG